MEAGSSTELPSVSSGVGGTKGINRSSHHFKIPNSIISLAPASNITTLAPMTSQALYQLSQGGHKLLPKLVS